MVLAAPGPLLTPPPSSSPPKTPHWSYSAQTRPQDEEKNPSPKQYLPPQTRTRHRRAHRPHVPKLMRGNTPPTTRSPPHRSRLTGNPPNLQPVTAATDSSLVQARKSGLTKANIDPQPPSTVVLQARAQLWKQSLQDVSNTNARATGSHLLWLCSRPVSTAAE
jgi:hypothetical protein